MDLRPGRPLAGHEVAELLHEARARTLLLVRSLAAEDLHIQHDPLMSSVVQNLGHIARFEEVWLLEKAAPEALDALLRHPHPTRSGQPLPSPAESMERMARVRRAVLDRLRDDDGPDKGAGGRRSYVFRMVLQHEYQHNEAILQTLQLKRGAPYAAPRSVEAPEPVPGSVPPPGTMIRFPGGEVEVGTDDRSEACDNERPRHRISLPPFWIDAAPVTCGQYLAFMEDGGYRRREAWSQEGWVWLQSEGAGAPRYWTPADGGWRERIMDRVREVDPRRPVCHVCYHEADAYARWAGKRLPTEFEWEAAASWDVESGSRGRFPWGEEPATAVLANVDALTFDTAPVGAYPRNVSPMGCYGMIGDVWEWTSSDFLGYPGFRAFPYREYSEVFFGSEHKVLRGGSWATRPGALRNTFRNRDLPVRRQIFSGLRCARDD